MRIGDEEDDINYYTPSIPDNHLRKASAPRVIREIKFFCQLPPNEQFPNKLKKSEASHEIKRNKPDAPINIVNG